MDRSGGRKMIELPYDSFSAVAHLFTPKKQLIPAIAVIRGNYPGRVFVDHLQRPHVAVVWATGRWMYLLGEVTTAQQKTSIKQFMQDTVICDCRKQKKNWFEIYTSDSKHLDNFFLKEIDKLRVDKHYESVYRLNVEKFLQVLRANCHERSDVNFKFETFDILPKGGSSNRKNSAELKKTVGVVVKRGDTVISIAKNNGFIFGKEYFIDIDTLIVEERRKGYATLAAIKLISYFLEKNMLPLWETAENNIASKKLAFKLGFEPIDTYPVFEFKIK